MQASGGMNGNYQFQSTTFKHKGSIRQVELVRQNEDVEEKQLLLSLPKWDGANQLGVSVMIPQSREKIRIIMNKVSQPLYGQWIIISLLFLRKISKPYHREERGMRMGIF